MRGRTTSALTSNTSRVNITHDTVRLLREAIVKYSAQTRTHAYNSCDCIVCLDDQAVFLFGKV